MLALLRLGETKDRARWLGALLLVLAGSVSPSAAQTRTVCEIIPPPNGVVLSVIGVRPWQQGDPLPAPDVIGLSTADMIQTRYKLANPTHRSLFYLAEPESIIPAAYTVHKPDEASGWISPMHEGFATGNAARWLELPAGAVVEFSRNEWHWGDKFQALAMFVGDKPTQQGRRKAISNPFQCQKVQ
jgi:hypothetical protein